MDSSVRERDFVIFLLSVLGDLTKENGGRELVCGRNEVVDVKKLVVLRTPKPFCVRWDQRTSSALVRWFNLGWPYTPAGLQRLESSCLLTFIFEFYGGARAFASINHKYLACCSAS